MLKIYLAGAQVFLTDAVATGERMKALCAQYGFEGHFPLDNVLEESDPAALAEKIRLANIAMIDACDIVIADLSPFRGPEPDSGTVWEVGYAMGRGKQVWGYCSDTRTLRARSCAMLGLGDAERDHEGLFIEDFGLSHNLMFAHCIVAQTLREVLEHLTCKAT